MKYLTGLLPAAFFANFLFAQLPAYHVQLIRHNDLMNPAEIEQIVKDDRGFLWLMAASKVQRYDGKIFKSYSFNERCVNIQTDEEGSIWLATRQSLYRFKNDYSGFEKIEHRPYENNAVRQLLFGPGKKLYLLHSKGIARWNNKERIFVHCGIAPFYASGSFTFLKSYGNSIFFRLDQHALGRYNVVSGQLDSVKIISPNFLYFINEDSVWVRQDIGSSALVSFVQKTIRPVQPAQFDKKFSDNNFHISGCYPSQQKEELIVFMDRKGYFSYNKTSQQFSSIKLFYNGLPLTGQPPLFNFYQEQNGTVWFANEEGVVHFNPYRSKIGLLRSSPLSAVESWNNDIRNFAEDSEGNIWFATANGFCKWDKSKGTVNAWKPNFESVSSLNYSSVRSIGYVEGKIIVGQSEKGFWLFDPVTQKFSRPRFESDSLGKIFLDDFNTNMVKLRNGNLLILSRYTWLVDKETFIVRRLNLKGIPSGFKTAYEDNKGRLWLVGVEGIYALDETLNVLYSLNIPEFRFWCNGFVQADNERFFAASKHIYEIRTAENGRLTWKMVFPELKDAHISHLFRDSLGRIWISSDKGLHRYIPGKEVIENFDADDNVQQFYAGLSNSFRGSDGTVYFGSMNGINYFIPEQIPLLNDSLQVYISNITVNRNDSSWLLGRFITQLNYTQNSLVFDFISPHIYNTGKLKYRYRLDGTDNTWMETGTNNSVRLTALKPGRYSFHAAATLNGKDWFESAPFSFTIKPPFWQTWWFRSLAVAALLVLMVAYFRRRINKVKSNAAAKQQMTELEVKALRAQMNPHFIFNAMNSIQQFTLKNDVNNANLYISKFSTLLRKVLHSSQQNYITLEEEMEQLNLYLDIEKLRLGNDFIYSLKADDEIETDALKIPGMLVQPFVENALKHGLAPKEGPKKLAVEFSLLTDDKLQVTITDNGIGRKKAQELKQQQEKMLPYESKGIRLVEERLKLVGGEQTENIIRFEDLHDTNGRAAGTLLSLVIPLHTA